MVYIRKIKAVLSTPQFDAWLRRLKDTQGKARILARLRRFSLGQGGDIKSVGGGVFELRIHTGPGYRLYLMSRSDYVILLLAGGDKTTQNRDIKAAKTLALQYGKKS